ncbi:MAG: hypothetical protein ACRD3O_14020 [Terriglobia bacterium]
MNFEIVGPLYQIETIAVGNSIRALRWLCEQYGEGRWRKLKGFAKVKVQSGRIRTAELHWYEAHGIGRRGIKVKRYLD